MIRFLLVAKTFLTIVILINGACFAQLTVTGGQSEGQLAEMLSGENVIIRNTSLSCDSNAYGFFNGTASNIGLHEGVLLTTGEIELAPGPNLSSGCGASNNYHGDLDLDTLAFPSITHDACLLQFDVIPAGSTLSFSYVFASEEYDEFVCANFNDAFGIFISGPGYDNVQNIARLPGTTLPVAINTVNGGHKGAQAISGTPCDTGNSYLFRSNIGGTTVEYDGFTIPLVAKTSVLPCSTYHVKLVIADVADIAYDSGIFLEKEGISCQDYAFPYNIALIEDTVCYGTSATLSVESISSDFFINWYYTLSDSNYFHSGGSFQTPLLNTTQSYYVEVKSQEGCLSKKMPINGFVYPRLFPGPVKVSQEVLSIPSAIVELGLTNPSGIIKYDWELGDGNISHSPKPIHEYTSPGEYSIDLKATDFYGCTYFWIMEDFITVIEDTYIWMPTAFSPNGDGINDQLYVLTKNITELRIYIWDKWGKLQFSSSDISLNWDGTNSLGELLPEGTYTFSIQARKYSGETFTKNGSITLLL